MLCLLFIRFQVHLHLKHGLLKYKYLNVINLLVTYLANFVNEVIIHCIQMYTYENKFNKTLVASLPISRITQMK